MIRLALILCLLALAAGCKTPPPDGCTPSATRCSPSGDPEVCSPDRYWTRVPGEPCAAPLGCCLTPSFYGGRPVHACVPAVACLPLDGGTPDAR